MRAGCGADPPAEGGEAGSCRAGRAPVEGGPGAGAADDGALRADRAAGSEAERFP